MQKFEFLRQPLLGELAMSWKKKKREKKIPFVVATYVYASRQGQRTHSARTNIYYLHLMKIVSSCAWNKTWVPSVLDNCAATSCQVIPFPPKGIGLQYTPDEKNNISLASEFSVYNPALPLTMKFPGGQFCGDNQEQMMIVGTIPSDGKEPPEIVFAGEGLDQAFHVRVDSDNEVVTRWGVALNVTQGEQGQPGEGTTIDRDEPFVLR